MAKELLSRKDVPVELTWDLSRIYENEDTMNIDVKKLLELKEEIVTTYKGNLNNAKIINETKKAGGRIIPVGTTSTRTLESNADEVKGNIYIWNIYNESNETSVEKPITIKFSKEKVAGPLVTNWPLLIISLLTVVLIGGILLVVVNKKNTKDK